MRPLGHKQRNVLDALRRHGQWHEYSGWCWDNTYGTRKVLESLVNRGLVTVDRITVYGKKVLVYKPKDVLDASV